jgi:hypothetical protein
MQTGQAARCAGDTGIGAAPAETEHRMNRSNRSLPLPLFLSTAPLLHARQRPPKTARTAGMSLRLSLGVTRICVPTR